jgi:hypothetical protein
MKLAHTLILGSLVVASMTAVAQDKKTQPAPVPAKPADAKADTKASPDASAEQAKWMAYMTPGEMHAILASEEGEWQEVMTFWEKPGAEPQKGDASCKTSMILGGRYQEALHTGTMMGMPFEGRLTIGYDNILKVFQSSWVDNMGTGIMNLTGKYDEKANTINYTGKGVDPSTGKQTDIRHVVKITDEKTRKIEMYCTKDGKEFKNMEIVMTRK